MINQAKRPILYLGGGVVHSGAAEAAVTLAEQASLPTTMTLMALAPCRWTIPVAGHAGHARRAVHQSGAGRM